MGLKKRDAKGDKKKSKKSKDKKPKGDKKKSKKSKDKKPKGDKKKSKKSKDKKKRGPRGGLQIAILAALENGPGLSKKQLLAHLRRREEASVRKVGDALATLINGGWVAQTGARTTAKFHAATR